METEFYLEQAPWPYIHAVVPIALYIALRAFLTSNRAAVLTLLLIYVWESFERILSYFLPVFVEPIDDTIIGDPILGATGVLAFWLIDQLTYADEAFKEVVVWYWAALVFVLIGGLTFVAGLGITPQFYTGLAVYAYVYFLASAIGYGIAIVASNRPAAMKRTVAKNVLVWLTLTAIYALVAVPVTPDDWRLLTSWWRAFWPSIIIVGVVLILILINRVRFY